MCAHRAVLLLEEIAWSADHVVAVEDARDVSEARAAYPEHALALVAVEQAMVPLATFPPSVRVG